MKKNLFLATALLLVFSSSTLAQIVGVDPQRNWKFLETPHFDIIYDERQERLARIVAAEAEKAHALITKFLNTEKPTRTPLVVEDTTDITNGYAMAIPYAQTHIFPTVPSSVETISEYESWVRELVRHEYTHIINFEPTHGVMSVLRFIFGGIVRPAGLLPRWYTEGLAVEAESRFTNLGRGRSSFYSAMVRAELESGSWGYETIDRLAVPDLPTWPRGQRPYGLGYFLMHEMSELASPEIYGELNHRYGGRIPFFLNGPVEDKFNKDLEELLKETYKRVGGRGQTQLETIRKTPVTDAVEIPQEGFWNFSSQVSPDGTMLALVTSVANEDMTVRILKRNDTKESFRVHTGWPKPVVAADFIRQVDWRADSRAFLFEKNVTVERFNEFFDVYEYNLDSKQSRRLTKGLRAREATYGKNGEIYFIQASGENTKLSTCTPSSNEPCTQAKILVEPAFGHRLSTPRYLDGILVYSHRDDSGSEWVETYQIDSGKTALITEPKKGSTQTTPQWISSPGKKSILYASNDSGVMNIFKKDLDKKDTDALSNTTTYLTGPTWDASTGEVLASKLTNQGLRIASFKPANNSSLKLQQVAPLQKYEPVPEEKIVPDDQAPVRKYTGLGYLWPQYWFPWFYGVPGGSVIDLMTSGSDPLQHHSYSLDLGFDSRSSNPKEAFSYTNASLPFNTDVFVSNDNAYLAGFKDVYRSFFGSLSTTHFIWGLSNDWTMGPSYEYWKSEYPGYRAEIQQGLGFALTYSHIDFPKDYQISPEHGGSFRLAHFYYPPSWSTTSFQTTRLRASYYHSKWLPDRHVLALKLSATHTQEQQSVLVGSSQTGSEITGSLTTPAYLMHGYPTGNFIGWTLISTNSEYRFPLTYIFSGPGTAPFFHKNWHMALVHDAVTLKGGYYDKDSRFRRTELGTFYTALGVEVRADVILAYMLPVTIKIGYYNGQSTEAGAFGSIYLGLGSSL